MIKKIENMIEESSQIFSQDIDTLKYRKSK